jgi:hypothetical protein
VPSSTLTRTLAPALGPDAEAGKAEDTRANAATAPQINTDLVRIPTSLRQPRSVAGMKNGLTG